MAEQPVGTPGTESDAGRHRGDGPAGDGAAGADLAEWPLQPVNRRPRAILRADLLPAVSVASLVALTGLPLAWVWSLIAPAERVLVLSGGQLSPLTDEDYHVFTGLAVFLLMGFGTGLIAGLAVWFLRERRGPVMMLAVVLGSLIAAWLGMRTGVSFAAGHYPVPSDPHLYDVLSKAPQLDSGWAVLAQPLGAALAYLLAAAWNGTPDLGRRLS